MLVAGHRRGRAGGRAGSRSLGHAVDPRSSKGSSPALAIGVTLPDGALLLPYLMVPALLAGVGGVRARGRRSSPGFEVFGLARRPRRSAARADDAPRAGSSSPRPWAVASLGAGLIGAWFGQLRGAPAHGSTRRRTSRPGGCSSQLRTVARRLSSGPRPGLAWPTQVLAAVHERARRHPVGGLRADRGRRAGPARLPRVRRQAGAPARAATSSTSAGRRCEPAHEPQASGLRRDPLAHRRCRCARAPG